MRATIRTTVLLLATATSLAQVDGRDHPGELPAGESVATEGSSTRTARADDRKDATGDGTSKAPVRADRSESENALVFRDVDVFDGSRMIRRMTVLVRGGMIRGIGANIAIPQPAQVIDGEGKTLLPGLFDAHTHLGATRGEQFLQDALNFGVTTELEMWGSDASLSLRKKMVDGGLSAIADFRTAGTGVTAPNGHPTQMGGPPIPTLSPSDDAQSFVDARIAEGADYIKVIHEPAHPTLTKQQIEDVVAAAHRRNKLVVIHISEQKYAVDAIAAGVDGLAHIFADSPPDPSFANLAAQHRGFVIPTLSVIERSTSAPDKSWWQDDPRVMPYVTPSMQSTLDRKFPPGFGAKLNLAYAKSTVDALRRAGVPVLAGTDAPAPGVAHGLSLHRELELLVLCGYTPLEALSSATSEPARIFGFHDRGRIAVGMRADLLLVNGDPAVNITATRDIVGIWKLGIPYQRHSADRSKAAVRADRVDAVIRAEMARRHIPGASVAVVRRDKVVLARGYGSANLELSAPATPDTVFQVASVTKPFVAMAILMLAEEEKVRLDEDIRTHISGLPDAWSGVTVRHLLTHTSGIQDYLDQLRMWSLREDIDPRGIVRKVAREPLNFRPGEKVRYSNTNYVLLGMVIERVSGKPWEVFLAERIFEPLGMTSTRRHDPAEIITNRASPYEESEGRMRNTGHLNPTLWFNADGGLISTVLDLAKWDAALGTEKLLKKSSLEQMWTPAKLGDGKAAVIGDNGAGKPNHYGLGWYISEYRGHRIVLHSGDKPGYSSTFIRFVDDELTVIALCNSQSGTPAFGMALAIADLYLSDPDRATE